MDHPKSEHSAQLIKVIPTYQPNRVLFHKPTDFRFKVVHQAVKQSGLFIIILVVQSERLIRIPIDPFVLSGDPRRYSCRATADCRGCPSLWDNRCGWCGNKRGIYSSLFWLLWKTLARGVAAFVGVPLK